MNAKRVLVVEDDARQRAMICMILSNAGYGIVEAQSVKTALMHLDIIDLSAIVLDVRLPNGHGRKVVDALIEKRDDVPVVVLTAYPEDAPTGFPVTSIIPKVPQSKCSKCGVPAQPFEDHCSSCGEQVKKEKSFRERLMEAVTKAREASDAIKSMRSSTRKIGENLKGN